MDHPTIDKKTKEYLQNNVSIIGLCGGAGSGKNHIAREYFVKNGYFSTSFATHLKLDIIGRKWCSYESLFHTKTQASRDKMQWYGTDKMRREWGEDIWIRTTFANIRSISEEMGITKFIITDARFLDEVSAIKSVGGRVLKIISNREDISMIENETLKDHRSETELLSLEDSIFDGIIDNSIGNESVVFDQIDEILGALQPN